MNKQISVPKRLAQAFGTASLFLGLLVVSATPALAQNIAPVDPNAADLPFKDILVKLVNWMGAFGLYASLAAMLAGGAWWGWASYNGRMQGQHRGQQLVIGGILGALIIGGSSAIVNAMFTAGGGG